MKSYRRIAVLVALVVLLPAIPSAEARPKVRLGDRSLQSGSRGHDVRVLQDFLARAGHPAGVDGMYGSRTRRAVRAFERTQRLPVDGRANRTDIRALRDVVNNGGALLRSSSVTGGAMRTQPIPPTEPAVQRLGPGFKATVGPDGLAVAPALAPPVVQAIIAAGNRIATMPYRYGGGHGNWDDTGYDCSGSVSYALHFAGLLEESMPSGGFMNWGERGPGQWVTIYAHGGHVYMVVAGLRFDTSGRSGAGTRWQADTRSDRGYTVVHPPGL